MTNKMSVSIGMALVYTFLLNQIYYALIHQTVRNTVSCLNFLMIEDLVLPTPDSVIMATP